MKWTYLIHLGVNMWKGPLGDSGPLGFYAEEMVTEYDAWRETIDTLKKNGVNTLIIDVAEGLQYESHPELSVKGAWTKDFLKKELEYIRSLGITPIPKLNFSTLHDSWMKEYSLMVSTPQYYQVVDDLIKEVGELFDTPEYFHIGMDEEAYNPYLPFWYIHMQVNQGQTVVRPNALFWEDMKYIASRVEKHGMNVWTWGCMIWVFPEETIKHLSKDWLISNACYSQMRNPQILTDYNRAAIKGYYLFAENGFKQVPTCMHVPSVNLEDTMFILKDQPNIEGYMMAPWFRTREIDVMTHKAAAKLMGHAIKKYNEGAYK